MPCEIVFDHEPSTCCLACGLEVDAYGNTEDDFRNCCFPYCGCDGARRCMANNGPSRFADSVNLEGMYQRKDKKAVAAKLELYAICTGLMSTLTMKKEQQ